MRTIRTRVYKFNELSETAKEKAIQWGAELNVDYEWWESTYEDAENIGLKIIEFDIDRYRHAKGEFTLSACEVAANIFREHGEICETHKTATKFMEEWEPAFAKYFETEEGDKELMDMENEFLNSLLDDYSIILEKEYEYLTSSEAVIEFIEANEYEFTKEGNRF